MVVQLWKLHFLSCTLRLTLSVPPALLLLISVSSGLPMRVPDWIDGCRSNILAEDSAIKDHWGVLIHPVQIAPPFSHFSDNSPRLLKHV